MHDTPLLPDSVFIERNWATDRFDVIGMMADSLEFVTLASRVKWLEAIECERRLTGGVAGRAV